MIKVVNDKTFMETKESPKIDWYVVDASEQIVGRLATRIARVLMGKHKPTYTPHVNDGDFVVVLNCEKVAFSGPPSRHESHPKYTAKMANKEYIHFTGYPSGRKVRSGAHILATNPSHILREAIRRMLPKNKLQSQMLKRLRLVVGSDHPYQAQQPQTLPECWMPKK